MPLASSNEQKTAKPFSRASPGLDRVAIRTQRNHLHWVVRTALGQVTDVIDLKNRIAAVGKVVRLTSASRILTIATAA